MLKKRVEVLFDESDYRRLEELARVKKQSVGTLIRKAVTKEYLGPDEERRREAFEWLRSQTFEGIGGDWQEIKEEIVAARMEQIERSLEAR